MAIYTFPSCGCTFDIISGLPVREGALPRLVLDTSNIRHECSMTWDLICEGRTKGVFQLESSLGQSWAKKLKPRTLEELADLTALLRPGCLKAIVNGKSMTQHYVDRKHGKEEIEYIHDSLEPILKSTQGVLVFQEQSMKIAQVIAGFDLQEADDLRKAIGKKKASLMAEVKDSFLKGAISKNVVSRETAEEIFSWIEKSNRYAFNKSHAVSYAMCGYWSAYCKAHFPLNFYCSYLFHAGSKPDPQQEIKELVSDARSIDININPPSIISANRNFTINNNTIEFGLENIKYIGVNHVEKLINCLKEQELKLNKPIEDFTWCDFLEHIADQSSSSVIESLILTGSLSCLKNFSTRSILLYEFKTWVGLTKKEREWIRDNCNHLHNLTDKLKQLAPTKKEGGGTANGNRKDIVQDLINQLENPPYPLEDFPNEIASEEERLLGVALTYSKIDSCDTTSANTTCKEFISGKNGRMTLAVEIKSCREWNILKGKLKGQTMAYLSVEDNTCLTDSMIAFPDAWTKFKHLLTERNTVLLSGERSKRKDSFIIDKVFQI